MYSTEAKGKSIQTKEFVNYEYRIHFSKTGMQQLNCKHSVCPYPRKGIHVSCLMTPSQAPFIALSILGNVLFMPQSKFINSLLDQCVATLSTHDLCAVIQADSKTPLC